jgi:hypothetical protein
LTACHDVEHGGSKELCHLFCVHPYGESATSWIARFSGRMAALQLLRMEQPFFVVAPCPAPGKPHTPARSTEVSRLNEEEA